MLYERLKSGKDADVAGMHIHPRRWWGDVCLFEIRKGDKFTVEYLTDAELFDWASHLENA